VKRRLSEMALVAMLALAAFGAGLLLIMFMMPRLVHRGGEVRVPDLTRLSFAEAQAAADARGLTASRAGERFDPDVPRGLVISQDPEPETPVRGRRSVSVVMSLGEESSTVPALYGETTRTAALLLERAGLAVGDVTRGPSDDLGIGLVVGTDPPAETVLPNGTAVSVLVSTGPGPEAFVMPDLLGREVRGVKRELESLGFRVYAPPAAPSFGPIVYQEPPAGSRITRNTSILLQASGRIIR
jgi:beta-lactam-binding protein with PASTA domain